MKPFPSLIELLKEDNKILITRRSPEERQKNYLIATNKKVQQYIKDGSKGNLDLYKIPITSLPDNLKKVGGYLSLYDTKITSLPAGLVVGGNLNLYDAPITSLPAGLVVRGNLTLSGTKITSLPADLEVGMYLFIGGTPLSKKYTKEQIKQMCPGVKGEIFL